MSQPVGDARGRRDCKRAYWIALIDFAPRTASTDPDVPEGGVAWVIGAASSVSAFKLLVASAPDFAAYQVREWIELGRLEPGYSTEGFDGDAIVATLESSGAAIFVDEIQWYMAADA